VRKLAGPLLIALALAACGKGAQEQNASAPANKNVPVTAAGQGGVTPMAQRVAVLGILNKRNGIVQNVTVRPGQSVRWKDVIVRLRACEKTAPWEEEQLTGAFIQLDVHQPDKSWKRVFSGWVYKESPSLNVVEHPVYDVWPKSCAMTYPAGRPAPAAPASSSSRSSAAKSGGAPGGEAVPSANAAAPPAAATPPPSAAESNAT
jgi:hypothetical protein